MKHHYFQISVRSVRFFTVMLFAAATQLISLLMPWAAAQAATFPLPAVDDDVVGKVQWVKARHEDTLVAIGRRFNMGYEEMRLANPDVDPWLPGKGTRVMIPARFILPEAPRDGIVINIAELRLYYYPKPRAGEQPVVVTFPLSIGRDGWQTPLGTTRLTSKRVDPVWRPPASIREEHAEMGDPLPAIVPAGPDNPLGRFALNLGIPGYLIHGTNKPSGVGMQVTHGCLRLYPEDIESLFEQTEVGTPVHIVNQPHKTGWHEGALYLEVHSPKYSNGDTGHFRPVMQALIKATEGRQTDDRQNNSLDWRRAERFAKAPLGIPLSLDVNDSSFQRFYKQRKSKAGSLMAESEPEEAPAKFPKVIHLHFPEQNH